VLTKSIFTLSKEKYSNRPLFPHTSTCVGGNPAFLEVSVEYTANKPLKFEGGGVDIALKQVFTNQYSCLAESKS
jgi:hypothetical protein